jgi:uncharacterized protein YndB with AHSA1/START domain
MGEARIHIDAAPEAVYAMVADITRMGEWSPETVSARWVDGASGAAVGAKFKGKNKRRMSWTTTCTVTDADPGRLFAFSVGKTHWRYEFAAADGGTDVVESFSFADEPGRLERFFTKVGTGVSWDERPAQMVEGMQETLRRVKAAAESAGSR